MFYGKRIKALEARIEQLEEKSMYTHPTEQEVYGSFFGFPLTRPRKIPLIWIVRGLLKHLDLSVKYDASLVKNRRK